MSTETREYAEAFSLLRTIDSERLRVWTERLKDKADLRGNEILLDVGCGSGRFAKPLASMVAKVIAVDHSSHMLSVCASSSPSNIEWIQAKAECIPVRDTSVDVVLASMLIEHLPEPLAFFHEAERVNKAGGLLLIRTMLPNDIDTTTWYKFLPSARQIELSRTRSLEDLVRLASLCAYSLVSVNSYVDPVDPNSTNLLRQKIAAGSYEVLSHISKKEIADALSEIDSAGPSLIESLSSSLVVFQKRVI